MNSNQILIELRKLQDDLIANGAPTEKFKVLRKLLLATLNTYKLELEYEKAKSKSPDLRVESIELAQPLSAKDRENIKEAVKLNRQIGKTITELNKAKAAK